MEISKRPISTFSLKATKSGQKLKTPSLRNNTPTQGLGFPCMYTSVIPLASLELFLIPTDQEKPQPSQPLQGGDTTQHSLQTMATEELSVDSEPLMLRRGGSSEIIEIAVPVQCSDIHRG